MRRASLAFVLVVLAACGEIRPAESPSIRTALPAEAIARSDPAVNPAGEAGYDDEDGQFNILALSGGGAYGAYGVGVLSGWTESGSRPEFDIVTGVSTGALISVFAFLGSEYDGLLRELYTTVENSDIFLDKGVAGVFSVSLYDNTPLRMQIERVVTADVLAMVAREHRRGRRLYIATTNLDSGQLVIWDMGAIAAGDRADPLLHFQKVLRASAAVPVFFEPVYIKPQQGVELRQAHVDGGLKAPVLVSDFLFRSDAEDKRLHVIVNDSLSERIAALPIAPEIPSIAEKAVSTLLRTSIVQAVYRGYVRAVLSGSRYRVTSVPDEFSESVGSLDFDPEVMRALFEAGRQRARGGTAWKTVPPNVEPFDEMR